MKHRALALLFPLLGFPISGICATSNADVESARQHITRGDYAAAQRLLQPLAAQGFAPALSELGLMYYAGRGVARDETRAYALLSSAAAAGDVPAMFWLARMNLLGDGPARDNPEADREAARWFFEAARRGHADAAYHLGLLFLSGAGVERNREEAMKWIGRAAAAGHAGAKQFSAP